MIVLKKIMTIVALCMATCTLWAQNEVSLVVSGEGKDKEEATLKALRSAIEQAYGTFVSANTTVLNDQLVADEIVSLSSGNIQKYEYVSETKMPDGSTFVTLSVTVSIDKLVSFAESKGMEAELKGGLFAMNIKKMEFDKQAEEKAVENLCKQLEAMLPTLFDYEIEVGEPKMVSQDIVGVNFSVINTPNDNLNTFIQTLYKTTSKIALNKKDLDNYVKSGLGAVGIFFRSPLLYSIKDVLLKNSAKEGLSKFLRGDAGKKTSWRYTRDGLGFYSSDISKYKEACMSLGVDCQLVKNPNYSAYGSDSQYYLVEVSYFYLRSSKSIQLLNSLCAKAVQNYYQVVINTGVKEIAVKVHESDRGYYIGCNSSHILVFEPVDGVKFLNRCTTADNNWMYSQWPISMETLNGILYFTKEEIANVTSISVSKVVTNK